MAILDYFPEISKEDATAVVLRMVALAVCESQKYAAQAIDVLSGTFLEDGFARWLLSLHDSVGDGQEDSQPRSSQLISLKPCNPAKAQAAIDAVRRLFSWAGQSVTVDGPWLLGRLYEELLEFTYEKSGDGWSRKAVSAAKKKGGNFFTPATLASVCVERTLQPLVSSISTSFSVGSFSVNSSLRSLLSLKILDPACGGGAFLLSALDYLVEAASRVVGDETKISKLRRLIARRCLYGVDIDPLAAEVTRLALWLAAKPGNFKSQLSRCFPQIKAGNALIGGWKSQIDTYPPDVWKRHKRIGNAALPSFEKAQACAVSCQTLRQRMNQWCALWFTPPAADGERAQEENWHTVVKTERFFHWELEFACVFANGSTRGFDAIVSNPPWEIEKPNSREFFSRYDPKYWTYGKQQATQKQKELFEKDAEIQYLWNQQCYRLKAMSRWVKCAALASSNSETPYHLQSLADVNAYKMFVEQSLFLLKPGGRLGMILPSNIYTDQGTTVLRRHLLRSCALNAILSFENRDGTFSIHRSFKFCILSASKSGVTENLTTTFAGTFSNWLKDQKTFEYPKHSVEHFSPKWNVLLELGHQRDLEVLNKIYDGSILVGDETVEFTREFDMTNDSGLFLLRDDLQREGVLSDVYGNWLKGRWREADGQNVITSANVVQSICGTRQISIDDIEAVILPVYEGRMVGQYDISQKEWCGGKGRRADWRSIGFENKLFGPQYLMLAGSYRMRYSNGRLKLGFLSIASATNSRSMICSVLPDLPCGNSVGVLRPHPSLVVDVDGLTDLQIALVLSCCFNSFVFDFALRTRLGGVNLNYFVLEECPLPNLSAFSQQCGGLEVLRALARAAASLTFTHRRFAKEWLTLSGTDANTHISWATQQDDRRRLRCTIEALVAHLYGVSESDFEFIMAECDLPISASACNPKGFWRVDKILQPHFRTTVQSIDAYKRLVRTGLQPDNLDIDVSTPAITGKQLETDCALLNSILLKSSEKLTRLVTMLIVTVLASCMLCVSGALSAPANLPAPPRAGLKVAVLAADSKTTMEDGKALWDTMHKQVLGWKEYRADVSLTLFKNGESKETKSRVFWRSPEEFRIEVVSAGFKSGSVMVKHKDGHVRIHGGPLLAFVKLTLDPDSRLLKMDNGRNVTKATIPNLVNELSEEMKGGLKCLVSSSAETIEGLPPVLEFQVLNPDGSMNARILATNDKHTPVRWERFAQGKNTSRAIFTNINVDPGFADNLFQLD